LELRHTLRFGGLVQFAAQLVQVGGRFTVLLSLGAVRLGSVRLSSTTFVNDPG
jgi:hypothetical protein